MELNQHHRYAYSPIVERPDFSWPEGRRLAFYLALNVEHFHFGGGLGHTPTSLGPQPDQRNFAWRDYGLRVGIWRIFDLIDELGLPLCHLLNSSLCTSHPQIIQRIIQRNDDVVGHGRTNSERQGDLNEEAEKQLILDATDQLTEAFGRRPLGWMGPWISESIHTPDLLREAGYSYLMDWPADDQPFWMQTRSGPILSVPYPIEVNDSPTMLSRMQSATDFAQIVIDQFEMMLELSTRHPLVCGIALHTFVVGQPFRLAQLRRVLAHVCNHPLRERVWFTTPTQIAEFAAKLPSGKIV